MRSAAAAVAVLALVHASDILASEPGQPLDCSDWVFLEPGLSCTVVVSNCATTDPWCRAGYNVAPSGEGDLLAVRLHREGTSTPCGASMFDVARVELVRLRGNATEIVAYLPWRCGSSTNADVAFTLGDEEAGFATFDDKTGSLYFAVRTYCAGNSVTCAYAPFPGPISLIRIRGFPTAFEILQTYTPSTNEIGFRVPYMPEGFPAADFFDTYYGPLTQPIDFTQAQPLQCGYPAAPPTVGDYLTVADTLPNPAPGTGRYYVTAVNHQGQRRYGRQSIGGVMSGRDPALLPVCSE